MTGWPGSAAAASASSSSPTTSCRGRPRWTTWPRRCCTKGSPQREPKGACPRVARATRSGRPPGPRALRALGRPAAARRHRPRPGHRPAAHPRRRAHGQPRLAFRRGGHGPLRGAARHGPHDRAHHPRRRRRAAGHAAGPHPRRDGGGVKLLDLVALAFGRLRTSRLRTALTMLGVIIGVASVVALVSVGQGSTANITARLSSLGTNLLTVNPGSANSGFTRGAAGSATTLTLADATALRGVTGLAGVAPEISSSQLVVAGDTNTTTSIVGTTADYPTVRNFSVWQGTFLLGRLGRLQAPGRRPGRDHGERPGPGRRGRGLRDHHRRPAVPGGGHPPGQGWLRLPGPRRHGAHPGHDAPEVLLGFSGRAHHRGQRRRCERHGCRQGEHHLAAERPPRAGGRRDGRLLDPGPGTAAGHRQRRERHAHRCCWAASPRSRSSWAASGS